MTFWLASGQFRRVPVVYNGAQVYLDLEPGKTTELTIENFLK